MPGGGMGGVGAVIRGPDETDGAGWLRIRAMPYPDLGTLVDQLVKLGLDFAAEALPAILTRAVKEDLGSPALLEQLLRGELDRREERRVRTSLRLSGLPTGQTGGHSSERRKSAQVPPEARGGLTVRFCSNDCGTPRFVSSSRACGRANPAPS